MSTKDQPLIVDKYEEVIALEDEQLLLRRQKLYGEKETKEELDNTRFGIALSGGGIRSATINLGMLKTLNKFGILQRADYLSTVSGGGYTGAYVQATLKQEGDYKKLFHDDHISYMRKRGEYLLPGSGWGKRWNMLIFTVGYIFSLMMSLLSPAIIIVLVAMSYTILTNLAKRAQLSVIHEWLPKDDFYWIAAVVLLGVFVVHFFANILSGFSLGISKKFNNIEAGLVSIILLWLAILFVSDLGAVDMESYGMETYHYLALPFLLIVLGFFTNPNNISFHRFYRNQLSEAFLHFTGPFRNIKIKDLFNAKSDKKADYLSPYPLINTCLNLQAMDGSDPRFKGAKANDYFLLSPMYCGSKLAKYVSTPKSFLDYQNMTLPAAITISAAAVNPGMGMYSNKLLSVLMTIFNARLGFWVSNPLQAHKRGLIWWPVYFFKELLSSMGTSNQKLNISDGGHIENLAVYELLRRRCRLIIAVDAGADPTFSFTDLENLTIRARNELGLDLKFRDDQIPEECIRPKPSHGYSKRRFAVANIFQLWEEILVKNEDESIMLDKEGKEVEVLINYGSLKEVLHYLSKEEQEELRELIDTLDLSNNIHEVINTLDLQEQDEIKAVMQSLKLKRNIRVVFESTMAMLNGIKGRLLGLVVDPEDRKNAFRQIVSAIEKQVKNNLKMGTLVYIKSSVTAPGGKPIIPRADELKYGTYKYKIYHPSFPHEPTSDQFFDKIQWESYYQLGQYIGADVLGIKNLSDYQKSETTGTYPKASFDLDIASLINHFDADLDLFAVKEEVVDAGETKVKSSRGPIVEDPIPVEMSGGGAPMPPDAGFEEAKSDAKAKTQVTEDKLTGGEEVDFKM